MINYFGKLSWTISLSFLRLSIFAFLLCLIFFLVYTLFIVKIRHDYAHIPSPPRKSFYLAHGSEFTERGTYKIFIQWAKECGSLFHIVILHKVMVFANSPRLAKAILHNLNLPKDRVTYEPVEKIVGQRFLGSGLASNRDPVTWKIHRSGLNPGFYRSTLRNIAQSFNETIEVFVTELNQKATTGETFSMAGLFGRTTLALIGQAAFSEDILVSEKTSTGEKNIVDAVHVALKALAYNTRNPFFFWLPWNYSFVSNVKEQIQFIREKARKLIESRKTAILLDESTPEDILDCIVRNLAPHCSMEELIDEVITILAAEESTSILLSFFIMELGRNPEILKELYEEIDTVVGTKETLLMEDLDNLILLNASIRETLRIYPPSGGIVRQTGAEKPVKIGGYLIPCQTSIVVNFAGIHNVFHKDGSQFLPQRFIEIIDVDKQESAMSEKRRRVRNYPDKVLSEEDIDGHISPTDKKHFTAMDHVHYSYIPFSMGHRNCIGRDFALLAAKIIATKFLQLFYFNLDLKETFEVENAGTFRPADCLYLTVRKR